MTFHYNMVIPYGDDLESLEVSLRDLPVNKVIALIPVEHDSRVVEKVERFLAGKGVSLETQTVEGNASDGLFLALSKVKSRLKNRNLLVNISTGASLYSHLVLCAAMATGVMAFGVFDGKIVFMPVSCSISHGQ